MHPADLIAAPSSYLNQTVTVEIVEALSGPLTPAALAAVEYPQVRVELRDGGGAELQLVPAEYRPEDPNRYKKKFSQVLNSPLQVKGDFLRDEEMTKAVHHPYYVIRVASWEPLAKPVAVPVASLAELQADPARWDRRRIVYEGIYENRFEVSALDREIWLSFGRDAEVIGKPATTGAAVRRDRVRVTGLLYAKPGMRYGHLGGYPFELLADKIEYLGPGTTR